MNRRLIAALLALVLAGAGGFVLLRYVQAADARALAGTETRRVLVVTAQVPEGTPATALQSAVEERLVPASVVAEGSLTTLADIAELRDLVTTAQLEPGEQLLRSRLGSADSRLAPGTVAVPAGDQEISVLLEPQRAVGGRLTAGDTVGVYVSIEFEDGTSNTHAVLHQVLVTEVQGAPAPVEPVAGAETASSGSVAPSSSLLITLAMTAGEAEIVVFGIEHGTLWLSLENDDADTSGTEVINQGNVYTKVPS